MYKLVLFDLDGTLADTDLLIVEGFLHFFRKYKNEKVSLDLLASFSGPSLKDSMNKCFPAYNSEELIQEFKDYTWPMYDTFISLYEGMNIVLKALKEKDIKVGIITSKMRIATEKTMIQLAIDEYIDYVISLEDVSVPKPNPEGVYKALEYFQISKCDTLFVGDAISDLLAATNASIDCCLVSWNLRGRHSNVSPKYYVNNYQELMEVILNGK